MTGGPDPERFTETSHDTAGHQRTSRRMRKPQDRYREDEPERDTQASQAPCQVSHGDRPRPQGAVRPHPLLQPLRCRAGTCGKAGIAASGDTGTLTRATPQCRRRQADHSVPAGWARRSRRVASRLPTRCGSDRYRRRPSPLPQQPAPQHPRCSSAAPGSPHRPIQRRPVQRVRVRRAPTARSSGGCAWFAADVRLQRAGQAATACSARPRPC